MHENESPVSFKSFVVPFNAVKAIHFLILLGCIVYANSLFNGFVGDDNGQILTNPLIQSLANFGQFFQGSTLFIEQVGQSAGLYYRPMLSITYAFLYSFFGASPFPFHFFQVALHITNSILFFLLLKKHLKVTTSFVLSAIFLIHPANNEAVVYIANMQEELFAFFGLLSLCLIRTGKTFYSIPLFLLLSLLSKETGIIFFPLTIFYYFLFSKRTINKTRFLLFSVFGVFIFYILLRVFVGNIGANTQFLYMAANATAIERFFTIPSLVMYYLRLVFFPVTLAFGWYWVIREPTITNFVMPLFFALAIFCLLAYWLFAFRKNKILYKTYLFYFVFLLMGMGVIIQIFPLDLTVADRWVYMPLLALLGLFGVVYEGYSKKIVKNKIVRLVGISLIICIVVFFAGRSMMRNTDWADNFTLCSHDVAINTKSYILEFCMSNEYYNRGEYKQAQIHGQKAVALYPEYFLSWYTLGKAYYATEERQQAKEAFLHALSFNDFSLGSEELALIYVYQKEPAKAREVANTYLKHLPYSAQLWYAKALAAYIEGNSIEATAAAKRAYELQSTPLTEKVYFRLKNNLPITF